MFFSCFIFPRMNSERSGPSSFRSFIYQRAREILSYSCRCFLVSKRAKRYGSSADLFKTRERAESVFLCQRAESLFFPIRRRMKKKKKRYGSSSRICCRYFFTKRPKGTSMALPPKTYFYQKIIQDSLPETARPGGL